MKNVQIDYSAQPGIDNYYAETAKRADQAAEAMIAAGGISTDAITFSLATHGEDLFDTAGLSWMANREATGSWHSMTVCLSGLRQVVEGFRRAQGKLFTISGGPLDPGNAPELSSKLFWLPPSEEPAPISYSIAKVALQTPHVPEAEPIPTYLGNARLTLFEVTSSVRSGRVTKKPVELDVIHNYTRPVGEPVRYGFGLPDSYQVSLLAVGVDSVLRALGGFDSPAKYPKTTEQALEIGAIGLAAARLGAE